MEIRSTHRTRVDPRRRLGIHGKVSGSLPECRPGSFPLARVVERGVAAEFTFCFTILRKGAISFCRGSTAKTHFSGRSGRRSRHVTGPGLIIDRGKLGVFGGSPVLRE
jgi:hypothetical protein